MRLPRHPTKQHLHSPRPFPPPPRAASADPAPPSTATASTLTLAAAAAARPHPDKAHYGGEDAYFVSVDVDGDGGGPAAIGVADGVGGWADSGINPAWYARTLMTLARAAVEGAPVARVTPADVGVCAPVPAGGPAPAPPAPEVSTPPTADYGEDGGANDASPSPLPTPRTPPTPAAAPVAALSAAHANTRLPGSATACVVALDAADATLHGAVVGDAGALVVRGGEVAFRSAGRSHGFDFPHQLAAAPDYAPETDTVEDAVAFRVPVQAGDVVIVASDGFFDNVWPAEAAALCPTDAAAAGPSPASVADALVALAAANAADPDYPSPYAADAAAAGVPLGGAPEPSPLDRLGALFGKAPPVADPVGGKLDDITVVVGVVKQA